MLNRYHYTILAIGCLLLAGCRTAKVKDKKLALKFQTDADKTAGAGTGKVLRKSSPGPGGTGTDGQNGGARGSGKSGKSGNGNGRTAEQKVSQSGTQSGTGRSTQKPATATSRHQAQIKKAAEAKTGLKQSDHPKNSQTNAAKAANSTVMQFLHLKPVSKSSEEQGKLPPMAAPAATVPLVISKPTHAATPTRPVPNAGEKLIAQLQRSEAANGVNQIAAKPLELALPQERPKKFTPPPPVKRKVNDGFMPYHKGEIVTLDSNMIPTKRSSQRVIVLYSGGSVYLSFKRADVQMNGLYVQGKFQVRAIVMDSFSGEKLPVAIMDRVK